MPARYTKDARLTFDCPGGVVGSSQDDHYDGSLVVESDSTAEALDYLRRKVRITRIESSRYEGCVRFRYQWRKTSA